MGADPLRRRLADDFERFGRAWPREFAAHVRETYRINLAARYLGIDLSHPIGKGSGQLSLNAAQLQADADAGLAYAVLKTVVAQDHAGTRSMEAWATGETRMRVERRPAESGESGWTVTWTGRGWGETFEAYLDLVRAGRDLARTGALAVIPSVKYHLPREDEAFREAEYRFTTAALAKAWGRPPLRVEVDFSPTLAGDPLAGARARVLRWLSDVPDRIRTAVSAPVRVALKLMNARFDDAFQVEMVRAAAAADALVVANRLFDERRRVAYGGWDLSARNLRVLDALRMAGVRPPQLAGTGNVQTGRIILDYARRGCESVQVHTFFQLPLGEYPASAGSRTARALHALVFHPVHGLVAGLLDLHATGALARRGGELHFLDVGADAHRTH